jgi:hypothetical protein
VLPRIQLDLDIQPAAGHNAAMIRFGGCLLALSLLDYPALAGVGAPLLLAGGLLWLMFGPPGPLY